MKKNSTIRTKPYFRNDSNRFSSNNIKKSFNRVHGIFNVTELNSAKNMYSLKYWFEKKSKENHSVKDLSIFEWKNKLN